ncbi:MAG: hypothetical protein ACLUSL_05145 [Ruminococcus sp.]
MRKRIAGAAVAAVMAVTSTMTGLSGLTASAANAVTSWGGGAQSDGVTLLVGEKSALRGQRWRKPLPMPTRPTSSALPHSSAYFWKTISNPMIPMQRDVLP